MGTTAAPAMVPAEDLEAAIAELPAKKGALREAFDRLAACSPHPLPFAWEDLDAHVSTVHSSISRRFSQLRALEAPRPARTGKNKEGASEVGEEEVDEEEEEEDEKVGEEEVEEEEEEEEVEEEEVEEDGEEEEEEVEEEEEADKQMQEADGYIGVEAKDAKEVGKDDKQDADEEAVTTKVSAGQGKEAEGEEELDGCAQWEGEEREQDTEEDVMVEKLTKKQRRGRRIKEFAEACARMDAGTLVEFMIRFNVDKKMLLTLHHAADPAALVLQVVKLLLSSKRSGLWAICIRLFRWLSMNSVKHSADTTEQAKLVAKDWKEMLGRPECCGEVESLARCLLQFLISYNIVSEFSTHEIISIFAMVPRKAHQKKRNHADNAKLCKDLGLADRATDLIDYMIGNGQHLEVFHVLQILKLEEKYPPFSLLMGYIEKAKQTLELFRKNETHESLNLAIPKEIWLAHQLAEQKLADSRQRSAILAEIRYLIGAYKKNQGSGNPSTLSAFSQHQPTKCNKKNKKRKKEELEHHEAQVNQQLLAQNENRLIQGKQHQLHQQEKKAQVTEQQQQHMQPPRPVTLKLPTPAIPLVLNGALIQNQQQQQQQPPRPATLKLPTPAIPLVLNGAQIQNHQQQEQQPPRSATLKLPTPAIPLVLNGAQIQNHHQQQQQPPRPATLKLPTPAIPLIMNGAHIQNHHHQQQQPPRPATLKLPTPAIPLVLDGAQIQNQQQQQQQEPPRPATLKLLTPAIPLVPNVAQIQNFGRPPYTATPGVHSYPGQPDWPVSQGMPFVPQFRSPQHMGLPFKPFALHPLPYPR